MQALLRQLPEQVFPAAGSWDVHQASPPLLLQVPCVIRWGSMPGTDCC